MCLDVVDCSRFLLTAAISTGFDTVLGQRHRGGTMEDLAGGILPQKWS